MTTLTTLQAIGSFVGDHLAAIGWSAVIVFVWKTSKAFTHALDKAAITASQVDTMATNHFPHMQASLAKQDGLLTSVDGSLKAIVTGSAESVALLRELNNQTRVRQHGKATRQKRKP